MTTVTIPDTIQPLAGDVSAEFTEWLATLEDGTTVEGPGPEFPYRCDFMVRLDELWGLTIRNWHRFTDLDAAASFTIDPTPTATQPYGYADFSKPVPERHYFRHTLIAGGGDLTFDCCGVDGPKPVGAGYDDRLEMQHGWELRGTQGALFIEPLVANVRGDFFRVGRRFPSKLSPGAVVEFQGGELSECGRQGFGIVETDGLRLRDVHVRGVARTCFDVEPNARNSVVQNVDIEGGSALDVRNNIMAVHGRGRQVHNVRIAGVGVQKVRISCGGGADRRGLTIENMGSLENAEMRSSQCPVEIGGWDEFSVRGVKQAMQPRRRMVGVLIRNPGSTWTVEGNEFPGSVAEYRVVET